MLLCFCALGLPGTCRPAAHVELSHRARRCSVSSPPSSILPAFSPHLLVPLSDAGTCAESGYKMREFEEWWEACGAMQEGGRERDEEAERGEEAGRHEVAADRRRGARNGRYGRVQDARARPEFYGFSSPLPPAALQASRIVTQALAPSSAPARTSGLVRVPPLL